MEVGKVREPHAVECLRESRQRDVQRLQPHPAGFEPPPTQRGADDRPGEAVVPESLLDRAGDADAIGVFRAWENAGGPVVEQAVIGSAATPAVGDLRPFALSWLRPRPVKGS